MDIIATIIDFLDEHDVVAVTELGENALFPQVRLQEAGGGRTDSRSPVWLRAQDIQVDVWAGSKAAAHDLAWDVHDLVLGWPRNQLEDGPVVSFTAATKPNYLPDDDWMSDGRPAPRFMLLVTVHAHERRNGS